MKIFPPTVVDFYKTGHLRQYPPGTEMVYSNFTCRSDKLARVLPDFDHKVVWFGLQGLCQWLLQDAWNEFFFKRPKAEVVATYQRRMDEALGPGAVSTEHIAALHDLGYLPVRIKALPEGSRVDIRVPMMTIRNTLPGFYWITNYLETQISAELWKAVHSATIAYEYRRLLDHYATKTGSPKEFVPWQGHDFSARGMSGVHDAMVSGAAHLLSFTGTDTVAAIDYLEHYYLAQGTFIGGSVPATEHSVMCMGGEDDEHETFRRLICDTYPEGVVSIVSDTWDFWHVLDGIAPALKEEILARRPNALGLAKVVFRPDSGDPVKIIAGGDPSSPQAMKGAVELLWDHFGGTTTSTGHRLLHERVGLIYGDSITLERASAILEALEKKGFASANVVFGIGSYCVSPDTMVLCADLIWRPAGTLSVGQEIIAFDENPSFGEASKAARQYRKATIKANAPMRKACSRIYTDGAEPIIASDDHPWLVWAQNRRQSNVAWGETREKDSFPRGPGLAWKTTNELAEGDLLAYFGDPWHVDESRSGGWLAGMFDGEGSISRLRKDRSIPHFKANISQNEGATLARLRRSLSMFGFSYYENDRSCPQLILTGGWYELLRFLGTIRPDRLLEKLPEVTENMPALVRDRTFSLRSVTRTEAIGMHPVASITTSCGTFITGGFLSHNTYQHATRDSFGCAIKATFGQVNGEDRILFKSPKTDTGIKHSAKGLLRVEREDGHYVLHEMQSWEDERRGELKVVFNDGDVLNLRSLAQIRDRLMAGG